MVYDPAAKNLTLSYYFAKRKSKAQEKVSPALPAVYSPLYFLRVAIPPRI